MSIKVFRVTIEGYVVSQDFGGTGPALTPADWGLEVIVKEMGADIEVTETLVDTIEDEEGRRNHSKEVNMVLLKGGKAFWQEFYDGTLGSYEDATHDVAKGRDPDNPETIPLIEAMQAQGLGAAGSARRTEFTGRLEVERDLAEFILSRLGRDIDKWIGRMDISECGIHLVKSGYRMIDQIKAQLAWEEEGGTHA